MAVRKKKAKTSVKAQNLADLKHLGDEPVFPTGHVLSASELLRTLNWYSYMSDVSEAREFLKSNKALKHVRDDQFPLTAAWIARIEARGAKVAQSEHDSAQKMIQNAVQNAVEPEAPEIASRVDRTIQERMRARVGAHIAEFEAALDVRDPNFSAYGYLESNKVPPLLAKQIMEYYAPLLLEVIDAHKGRDEQLVEGYASMGRRGQKALFDWLNAVLKDVEKYVNGMKAQKAPRKPRKAKAIDPAKKLKALKFKTADDILKVKSVNPISLLGAQEVWTFNTKTRIMAVYRADGPKGLDIKGTTVIGFDTKKSIGKRLREKAVTVMIERVLNFGKIAKRTLLDQVATVQLEVNGRINNDTLILSATK